MEMASNTMTAACMGEGTGEAELESAVRDHARLVYRVCYSVLRNHHDAEDATQETFLRVMRFSAKLREARDPKHWLARVAWRVAIDRRPKVTDALRNADDSAEQLRSHEAGAEAVLQSAQMQATVERLIAALPAKLREPLVLSTLEELTPPDVAAVLGISEAAVRSRVFRARQILREKLEVTLQAKGTGR